MLRSRVLVVVLALLAPVIPLATPGVVAQAASCTTSPPGPYPNDPQFAPFERGVAGQTWDSEAWYLYGCLPNRPAPPGGAPAATDPQGASGMSVSDLWNRATNPQRGRDDTVVGYVEGGINWRIAASCELKDRAELNTGELPYPQNAAGQTKPDLIALGQSFINNNPYDLNNDGVVNVEDYLNDQRVINGVAGAQQTPPGGPYLHHVCSTAVAGGTDITPEDLIVAFGHCKVTNGALDTSVGSGGCPANGRFDNDHNGYPNDINGWNFNRDNNDPQAEQSVYAHFTDESAQLVGEGNNGYRNVGLCPKCRYVPIKAGDEAIDRPDRVAEAIVYAATIGISVLDVTSASLGLNQSVQAAINYGYSLGMTTVFASNDFESSDHTDGMYYAKVWPGNSLTGDHSTRSGATCPPDPSPTSAFCPYIETNTTFDSRSSLTSYGAHALFSTPNSDGSTSTGTPTNAGVAALVVSEGKDAAARHQISTPLTPNEVRQVVRSTALPINAPCPPAEPCFSAPAGSSFNIQYGYGRPNLLAAATAIDSNHVPPSAELTSPSWYQWVDPTKTPSLQVSADVSAERAPGRSFSWQLQYGVGPQPNDSTGWHTFAAGNGSGPSTVSGTIVFDPANFPPSLWGGQYAVDAASRLSIEAYDVTVRVQVTASVDSNPADGTLMGEDRRAFHLRHDDSELAGFPLNLGASGESSPTMADIEGRGWLDTVVATSDGKVHAIRPDGSEAPGFPVSTGPAIGMDPAYGNNYLSAWHNNGVPPPGDEIASALAIGDLNHTGALDIVGSTLNGKTWAWDGLGRVLPGFPVLNGIPSQYGLSVPPPDTPYSFEPENVSFPSAVLADLEGNGRLDIVQAAGDNHVYAWRANGTPVPGWPVATPLPGGAVGTTTHDSKIIPTPAVVDINGDGRQDVVVGLDDSILGTGPNGAGVKGFLLAYDGRGTNAPNGGLLPGYPVQIPGLIQGYGVAQDFVTQGVESPVVYDQPPGGAPGTGPKAVVNANLFFPVRVDLKTATVETPGGFSPAVIPAQASTTIPQSSGNSCPLPFTPSPGNTTPGFATSCALVPFTTSAALGKVQANQPTPFAFQAGSSATDVVLGITQTPGIGVRVDNGMGAWDPSTGVNQGQYNRYIQGLAFFGSPSIADVTGDGFPDILQAADSGALMGFDGVTGQSLQTVNPTAGFPKWTGGWSLFAPATGDLTGHGATDVSVMTREGYLSAWTTGGNGCTGNNESWHWHQDDRNTGHYATDTRPPSAISDLAVSRSAGSDTLAFTAVGDDWKCGTATSYQLFTSPSPINQDNVGAATAITVSKTPDPSGTHETFSISSGQNQGFLAIRAVDKVGNLGPLALGPAPPTNVAEFGLGGAAGLALPVALVAGAAARSRRRRRGVPAQSGSRR